MVYSDEDDYSFPSHDSIIPQANINALFQSKTEKGIRKLCCELLDLKDGVENLHGNISTKLLAFFRISEEVVEMKQELANLKNHVSTQSNLVQDLLSTVCHEVEQCVNIENGDFHNAQIDPQTSQFHETLSSINEDHHITTVFESIDMLLIEHKVEEALELLEQLPESSKLGDASPTFKVAFMKRQTILEDQLIEVIDQPSLSLLEVKKALSCLKKLGKGPLAHQLLLKSYGSRLHNNIQAALPSCILCPKTFPTLFSKLVFSMISIILRESGLMFGDNPAYINRIIQWAEWEIESFVRLVKDNTPSSETAAALRVASICIETSISHCSLLESQGLQLSKLLMVLLCKYTEEILESNFRRSKRVVLNLARNEEIISESPHFSFSLSAFSELLDNAFVDSGIRFLSVIREMVEQLTSLTILHFGGSILSRISHLFDLYVDFLIKALPGPTDDENLMELKDSSSYRVETDSQQIALLGLASTISDNLSPEFLSGFWTKQNDIEEVRTPYLEDFVPIASSILEYREWKRRLMHSCDKLRDHFCRQYVLNFIYSKDGKARLDAQIYLNEDLIWDSDPLPSIPFQALFTNLLHLAAVAGDVLLILKKEKIQKSLLARLTETVVMWLSDEQDFWGVFEDDSIPLNSIGLQQLILDMHFVVEIARFAGYPSRHVHQIASSIIARAIRTFSARGIQPQSLVGDDEWFAEAAKAAINKLVMGTSDSDASETDEEHHLHEEMTSDSETISHSSLPISHSSDSFASAVDELESPTHSHQLS